MSEENQQDTGRCRTALFVDFDNVYLGLEAEDASIAAAFATQPSMWIDWLEQTLPLADGQFAPGSRRILVRRCYLNPKSFGRFRPYMLRAGFETIDCPALTYHGKTSADVHMVMDMLDNLSHRTHFDEFIVMSADADFTPVLIRLREYDRRTAVLAVGPSSAAYKAACDILISQDDFLGIFASEEEPAPPPPPKPSRTQAPTRKIGKKQREALSEHIQEIMDGAGGMIAMAALAQSLTSRDPKLKENWGGYGSFTLLLAELDLGSYERSDVPPGYLYDPEKHSAPTAEKTPLNSSFSDVADDLTELATKIYQITDTPFLTPKQYRSVFEHIAVEINKNGYQLTRVSKAVRDGCREDDVPVGRQHINFLLRGISFSGHRFGRQEETADQLAQQLYENTISLCSRAQLDLSPEEEQLVSLWLVGKEQPAKVAPE